MRPQLANISSVEDVINCLLTCRHIVLLTGAGISVSCGIPDFRSSNGIYNTVDCHELNIPSPELLFDLQFFQLDPLPFYRFSSVFYSSSLPSSATPSLDSSSSSCSPFLPSRTHRFIASLEKKKRLLRNYTQNVDGIERIAGIRRLIECHGNRPLSF